MELVITNTFLEQFQAQLREKAILLDNGQEQVVSALANLNERLSVYQPRNQGVLSSLFGLNGSDEMPKGLYIYGGVGRGKTMLMDLFFDTVQFEPKQRYHFNEFMALTHDHIATFRKSTEGDPIPLVASEIAKQAKLLCFDEFYVTDITDAMILSRLFNALFNEGVVVVATSNAAISDLYKDGLNRQLFMPFIELLQQKMILHKLESPTDFRLLAGNETNFYFTPNNQEADEALCLLWQRVTGKGEGEMVKLNVKGRELIVPEAVAGVARFTFEDLCDQPLGRDDYLAIADNYHTVFVENIPVMGPSMRNQARRFITLIDTFYDRQICLIASSEAEPGKLYQSGDNSDLFERTSSRLIEMKTAAHLENEITRPQNLQSASKIAEYPG